ncbi:hypothetical protein MJO29_011390 [Puccinia striiformis f. sp. tritici]|nr:hypothetical protein MJO29_011390 [Puccinia striiformis f. sp. tritici]
MGRVGSDPRGSLSNPLRHGAGPGRGSSPWDSPADPPRKQTGRRGSSRVTRGAGRVPGHRNSRLSLAAGKNHLRPSHQDRAHDYYPLHIKGIHITKQNICPITADGQLLAYLLLHLASLASSSNILALTKLLGSYLHHRTCSFHRSIAEVLPTTRLSDVFNDSMMQLSAAFGYLNTASIEDYNQCLFLESCVSASLTTMSPTQVDSVLI